MPAVNAHGATGDHGQDDPDHDHDHRDDHRGDHRGDHQDDHAADHAADHRDDHVADHQDAASAEVVSLDGCVLDSPDAARVAAAQARILGADDAGRAAELFRLLGDPNRVRLLSALLEAGELCVCDIAASIGASESSVSHALRLLRTAHVVRVRRSGRRMYYSLDDAHVRLLLDVSIEHVRHESSS